MSETNQLRFEKIDQKYDGFITKTNSREAVPADEWIVFRAKDLALLPTLQAYLGECIKLGCSEKHLNGIVELMVKVHSFQKNNPSRCKIPD